MTTFTPPKGGEFFFRRMRRGVEHDAETDQGVDTLIDNFEGVMYYLEDILDDDKESNFKLASKSKGSLQKQKFGKVPNFIRPPHPLG